MGRGAKKEAEKALSEAHPEAEERKRRKRQAFSKGILSEAPAKTEALSPCKTVVKHHGRDILRKSQRKNRFLFSFPGLLAPISGGKIGELKDLGTKNPLLYLDFPQGQMKFFGTIVYPKNRYLTLQFSRGGKNVMCEDYFDAMIVFSDAWWIGRKDENPEEARLEFPKELGEVHNTDYDFKGGAGVASEKKQEINKPGLEYFEQQSSKTDLDGDSSDCENILKGLPQLTPVRHSERTAGKRFKFAEGSSEDDFIASDADTPEREDKKVDVEHPTRDCARGEIGNATPLMLDVDRKDATGRTTFAKQIQGSAPSISKPKELSYCNHSSLVQTTISTLFKKVEEQNENSVQPAKVYKRKTKSLVHSTTATEKDGQCSRASNSKSALRLTCSRVEADDDIEEFSSASKEDSNASDEDWAG
ncbi:hypothetical protein NMG60_11035225 [Bertholletia excelsa]